MNFKEVIKLREVQPDDLLVDVIVAEVESVNVRTVLSLTSASLPLQRYNLDHLKRIQKTDAVRDGSNGSVASKSVKLLHIVICPVAVYNDHVPAELKSLFLSTLVAKVPKLAPQVYSEFEVWSKYWPLIFHAPEIERVRTAAKAAGEVETFQKRCNLYMEAVAEDAALLRRFGLDIGGCVLVNPAANKVVMTAAVALQHLVLKAPSMVIPSGSSSDGASGRGPGTAGCDESVPLTAEQAGVISRLKGHPLYQSPVLLCIDGVAALVNEEIDVPVCTAGLPPNQYICTGLVLYTSREPDLFVSMALLHSRILQVVFGDKAPATGALGSAAWLHCLPAVNHNFRVFCADQGDGRDESPSSA